MAAPMPRQRSAAQLDFKFGHEFYYEENNWSCPFALPADKVRGVMNSQIVWSFAETLSAAPRPHSLRPDDGEFVVFCFKRSEDADAFCEQFGGERLPEPRR